MTAVLLPTLDSYKGSTFMYCDQCGTAVKPNAKFCQNCGHQIQEPVSATGSPTLQRVEEAERQPEPQPQAEETIPSAKVVAGHHPWRRLFARTVDIALAAPLLYLLLFNNFGKNNPFAELFFGTDGAVWLLDRPVFIVVLIYVLWVPIEAAFLTWFGATIGKWAFGIRVLDADGNRLSYGPALERSLWVLSTGVAFGIPFVILVSGFIAYKRLEKKGVTFWDERVESSVLCQPWTLAGSVICAFVTVLTLFCAVLMPVIVAKLQINYWAGRGDLPPLSSSTNVPQPETAKPAGKGNESPEKKPIVDIEKKRKLEAAANQGDAVAQYELGALFNTEKDYIKAERWLRLSADQGNAPAQVTLGNLFGFSAWLRKYEGEENVLFNPQESVRLYRLAANQGSAEGQFALGEAYLVGMGVEKDEKQARHYQKLAANQRHAPAVCMLGLYYDIKEYLSDIEQRRGRVVAYALYVFGSSIDPKNVNCLGGSDRLEKELTKVQISIGKVLAGEMMNRKPIDVIARYMLTGSAVQ